MQMRLLFSVLLLSLMLLCNLCTPAESSRVIFYNKKPTVRTGQLLHTERRLGPCPKGKMRDHRGRCRRAIMFVRKTSN